MSRICSLAASIAVLAMSMLVPASAQQPTDLNGQNKPVVNNFRCPAGVGCPKPRKPVLLNQAATKFDAPKQQPPQPLRPKH